jgi:hypothetical protein
MNPSSIRFLHRPVVAVAALSLLLAACGTPAPGPALAISTCNTPTPLSGLPGNAIDSATAGLFDDWVQVRTDLNTSVLAQARAQATASLNATIPLTTCPARCATAQEVLPRSFTDVRTISSDRRFGVGPVRLPGVVYTIAISSTANTNMQCVVAPAGTPGTPGVPGTPPAPGG